MKATPLQLEPIDGGWTADVSDGLLGPAGSVYLDLDGLSLEFDRTRDRRLLTVTIPDDAAAAATKAIEALLPRANELQHTDSPVALELVASERWLAHAALAASIQTELLEAISDTSNQAKAFRAVANLELASVAYALNQEIPGSISQDHPHIRAVHILDGPGSEEVWASLLDPRSQPLGELRDLFDAVIHRGLEIPAEWRSRTEIPVDIVDRVPTRFEDAEELAGAIRDPQVRTPSPVPQQTVDESGRFIVAPSAVLGESAHGYLQEDEDLPGYKIELAGVNRHVSGALGPLWIRLHGRHGLVAAGPVAGDDDETGRIEAIFPVLPGALPRIVKIDVWVNPYRFPDDQALQRQFRISDLADKAGELGRRANRFTGVRAMDAWRHCAEAWLAAGYLDRASLAFGLGESEEAPVWARAEQTFERLRRKVSAAPRLLCLQWHPDVVGVE